jgi:ZIP family zinc transporter
MNRVVLDGMLGFTGGVMVAASFEFIGPAIEMTGGEGFAKVMPAAFGFLGALFIFWD